MNHNPLFRSLFFLLLACMSTGIMLAQQAPAYIANPSFPGEERIRYDIDVTLPPYSASGQGVLNDRNALQSAIDDLSDAGGGVIYLPPGQYRMGNRIIVRDGVTLRGVWRDPNTPFDATKQTIILTDYDPTTQPVGSPAYSTVIDTTAHFIMGRTTGLKDLAFYDPSQAAPFINTNNQAVFNPVVRPWTINQRNTIQVTIERVNIYNAWGAVRLGPRPNENTTVRDVYVTAFNKAFERDEVFDVSRYQNLVIDTKTYTNSGLGFAVDDPKFGALNNRLVRYCRDNAIGIDFKHFAWTWMYNVKIQNYNIGVILNRTNQRRSGRGPCGGFLKLTLTNNRTGIALGDANDQGTVFTDVNIFANLDGAVGIRTLKASSTGGRLDDYNDDFKAVAQFNKIRFWGQKMENAIWTQGPGNLTCTNCTFDDRAQGQADVLIEDGNVVVSNSIFRSADKNLRISGTTGYAIFSANTYKTSNGNNSNTALAAQYVDDACDADQLKFATTSFPIRKYLQNGRQYLYKDRIFTPGSATFIDVVGERGVDNTGATNVRGAIQTALDDLRPTGGVVFLRAGRYRVNGALVIPTGVQLRGIHDNPHFTNLQAANVVTKRLGTVIQANVSVNSNVIRMEAGSGIRGFKVWYPTQRWVDYIPAGIDPDEPFVDRTITKAMYNARQGGFQQRFDFTIRAEGNDVVMRDITLVNSYRGVRIPDNADNALLVGVQGTAFHKAIQVEGDRTNVRDAQFNWTFWRRSFALPNSPTINVYDENNWRIQRFAAYRRTEGYDAFILDGATDQNWLHCFVFKTRNGFLIKGNTWGELAAIGADESETPISIRGGGFNRAGQNLSIINGQFVSQKSPYDKRAIRITSEAGSKFINLYNSLTWGNRASADGGVFVSGGNVDVQNINFERHSEVKTTGGLSNFFGVFQNGGTLALTAPFFKRDVVQVVPSNPNETTFNYGRYFGFENVTGNQTRITGYYWDANPPARQEGNVVTYRGNTQNTVQWFPTWAAMGSAPGCVNNLAPIDPLGTSLVATPSFAVFPNPTHDVLNIRFPKGWNEEGQYRLFDLNGRVLRQGVLQMGLQLSTEDLSSGVYLLEFNDGEAFQQRLRIVKQ